MDTTPTGDSSADVNEGQAPADQVTAASPPPTSANKVNLAKADDPAEYIRRLERELESLRKPKDEPVEQVQTHTALLASGKTVPVFGAVPTHHYDEELEQTVPVVTAWTVKGS